ncbi:hypothetical protein A6B38_00680 [Bartonella bacilliformis]|uniref:Uncharacterized protein n=2 Tax=Bartonella bacilliformis TaxID=774 RepID=A1UQZ8_BARBK|nr:conserved hypothetical protein [Bartonella bacilliformis KC583]AMG85297.1 hypothetical protein AL467_00475 [Bartonella bacilliformis]EYS88802.1 hypothetical protein X472_00889 [Bartonella bacilliformis San Pedro600-02]KZN22216.1 hypothetical protein A6B38_00680 [Bartonella bacilliformis]QFZ89899.1 hypothetical protein GHC17_00310 [Bartonella bacilliformis]
MGSVWLLKFLSFYYFIISNEREKETVMVDSSKPKENPHYKGVKRKASVIEHEEMRDDSEQKTQNLAESSALQESAVVKKQSKEKQKEKSRCSFSVALICLLISGIVSVLTTLSLLIGFQRDGSLFPFLSRHNSATEQALQMAKTAQNQSEATERQLTHLLQELDLLKTDVSSVSQSVSLFEKEMSFKEEVGKNVADLERQVAVLEDKVQALVETSKDMEAVLSSQNFEETQSNKILQEENKKTLTNLEQKVMLFEEHVKNSAEMSKDRSTSLTENNIENDVMELKKQLNTLQENMATKSGEEKSVNMQMLTAVSALKNAVMRGGPFIDELKAVQKFFPELPGLDILQKKARTGFSNSRKLAHDFAAVADIIVGLQNIVAPEAGFFAQILTWMKGLFVTRPIGDIAGTTMEAIVARMEAAIQEGNYEKALEEWEALPKNAQDASADFAKQLKQKLSVRNILQDLLTSIQQGRFETRKSK